MQTVYLAEGCASVISYVLKDALELHVQYSLPDGEH